jgi:predicted ATPase/DNA-binding SARP family transcriptional activator
MEFRILGPLQVVVEETPVPVRGAGERALLALLLLDAGRVVPAERLIDSLWGEALPSDPVHALHARASRLRHELCRIGLSKSLVVARRPGYVLDVDPGVVDVHRFQRLVGQLRLSAERGGASARRLYAEALGLWRGPALAEFGSQAWARDQASRLEEMRLCVVEEWAETRLAAGQHAELIGELAELVAQHPLRERLHGQLMLALYRSGRQAEALAVFQRARTTLVDELGLDPSTELRNLEQAMLRQDPWLAAPLRALEEEPPALPSRLTSFVGRTRERAVLRELLMSRRLVTLTGPGGVGKTSLAVQVATAAADRARDASWLVTLAGVDEGSALAAAVADALGAPPGPEAAEDRVLRFLRPRAALVVLDNCEHLAPACAVLVNRLLRACPRLRVLATSREPIGIAGEAQFPLSPLPTPPSGAAMGELAAFDSVRLLVDRARDADPGFALDEASAPAVAHICRQLDGLPLAIELAAARLKALPVTEIAARLDDRFRLLTAGPRTADARHRTLRATMDWSHQLLTDAERVLFRRLAAFRGGWSLEAAEEVCGGAHLADPEFLDLHARLVDRSLVVPRRGSEARFGMLETLRQYADERLGEAGERDRLEAAHAAYFTRLAERAEARLRGPEQEHWLGVLRRERDNLRAALAWGRAHSDTSELGLRLAAALGWFWYFTSAPEGTAELQTMLSAARSASRQARARALQAIAVAARPGSCIVHPDPRCAAAARASLELFIELGGTLAAAYSAALLAVEAIAGADRAESLAMLDDATAEFDRVGDDWGRALAQFVRSELYFLTGDADAATGCSQQALGLFRALEDHWGVSAVHYHRGLALHRAGRLRAALSAHEAVLAEGRRGRAKAVQYALADMGHIALALADLDRAAQHFAAARVAAAQSGAEGNALASLGEGHLAREHGNLATAAQHYQKALRLLADRATPEWEAAALVGLGFVAELSGNLDAAENYHRRAWQAAAQSVTAAAAAATALEGLACVAAARGDGGTAANLLGTAARWRRSQHRPSLGIEQHDIDRAAAGARELLGDDAYRVAYARGLQPPADVVVDLQNPVEPRLAAWLREPVHRPV